MHESDNIIIPKFFAQRATPKFIKLQNQHYTTTKVHIMHVGMKKTTVLSEQLHTLLLWIPWVSLAFGKNISIKNEISEGISKPFVWINF